MAGRLLLSLTVALAALGVSGAPAAGFNKADASYLGLPIVNPNERHPIPHRFIVVYNNTFNDDDIEAHEATVIQTVAKRNIAKRSPMTGRLLSTSVNKYKINGWHALALEADDLLINEIYSAKEVSYIEQDAEITINARVTQARPPTGLARISSARAGARMYSFDDSAGEGITAYVVDTGIRITHEQFEGRATFGINTIDDIDTDTEGHGTHVAGTIGGRDFGVAKKVKLVAVKVLGRGGAGSRSSVLAGMQFVANNATASGLRGKAVMNMSLGGGFSPALNAAINNVEAAGVVPVVAAGNDNEDTANTSPGSAERALTVGAIDQRNDARAVFSNHGPLVDIFAPGVNVLSAWNTSDTDSFIIDGTSMAAPHVAGIAAYLMALEGITGVQDVAARIKELAQQTGARVRNNVRGTTSLIANNGIRD